MTIGRTRSDIWRQFVLWTLAAALLLIASAVFERNAWAEAGEEPSVEDIKKSLDEIEAAVDGEDITAETLAGFRDTLNSSADILRKKIDWLEPRAQEAEDRLKELGPAPAKDAPAESPEIASQRKELTQQFNDVDGELKQARVLTVRTGQLGDRVAQKRHALYANELFARSPSVLDPTFWADVYRALPIELRSIKALLDAWSEHHTRPRWAAAALIIIIVIALAFALTRWWLPRLIGEPSNTRSAKAWAALWVFAWFAIRMPLAGFAALLALTTFGLLTVRLEQIAQGIVAGMAAAAFGYGVARGLLAPEHPHRRLVQEDDETALCFYNHLVWASRALGVLIVLQVIHKVLFAPLVITVATNALFAAATAAFLVHLVLRLGSIKKKHGDALIAASWAYPLGLLMAVLIIVALVAGYAGVAAFISLRVIVAAAVFGALFLLLVITQTLFASINEQTAKGQMLAESLGINARTLGLSGTLLSALIRVLLIVSAFLLIIGPWEVSTADLFDTVRNIPFGFKIGEIRVSFQAILAAIVVLVLLLVVVRLMQRWLERELLPRTALEPSLQLSIVTIFGYLGAITAIAFALSGLGFDLQKIALIAGALSVGIGFGLQSIVSNFVSGLILLTERPIRVGDSIVVKGEEGWVRRVRVRATEIETFDRASVIIPNSEFITGVVKNWTRTNRLGRIVVKVAVGYESDPDQVRDILTDIANAHPQIVQTPPPAAYLVAFGETALEFELRCVVAEVEKGLSIRSDLHYAIIQRFREAAIGRFGPKSSGAPESGSAPESGGAPETGSAQMSEK
jgi:potassium-dependent mechanosensitive channel